MWRAVAASAALWGGLLLGWGRVGPRAGAVLAATALLVLGGWLRHLPRPPPPRDPAVTGRVLSERDRVLAAAGFLPPTRPLARSRSRAALVLVFLALGLGWAGLRLGPPPALGPLDGRSAAFSGVARSDVRINDFGWSVEGRLERADEARVDLVAWLSGRGEPPSIEAGEELAGVGRFDGVAPGPGFEGSLADRGVAALVDVSDLERTGPPSSVWLRTANAVRDALARGARRALPPRAAGLLLGLTIGETRGMHPETVEDFRATGLGHLVAVSGSNVVMVVVPVLALAAVAGIGARGRLAVAIPAVILFALITRWEPSVLRASAMAALALVGVASGRTRESAGVLAWSVALLLLADPRLARSLAFQLSTAATAGLLAITPPLAARLRWLPRPVAVAAAATTGAQLAVTPMLLAAFGIVPGATLVANVLAFPAVAAAFLGGVAASFVALASPRIGSAAGAVASLPIRYLDAVADTTAKLSLPALVGWGWIAPAAVAVIVALALRRVLPGRAAVALVLVPAVLWAGVLRGAPPPAFEVRFLDVGQGDAALVRTPAGATILVDAGPDDHDVAIRLAALGVGRLDLAVASHAHQDHIEGFPAVFSRHRVGALLEPGCPAESPSYARMLAAAEDEGIPVRRPRGGDVLRLGPLRIDVLGPDACATDSPNDDSLVLRLSHGASTVLLPGDAEIPAQADLLADDDPVAAVVLKVPHHGSSTSDPAFFEAVGASFAVVSVGPNEYGHPVPETLAVLAATGARVLRTDLLGEVVVRFGGRTPLVSTG